MKVVIYVRVSTAEQAKEGYSVGEQLERLTKYCEAMNWTIVAQYVDPGYSGADTNRPGLKELIKAVEDGGIDKVVVYKLDRLSRSQKDTLALIEDVFLKNKTDFVSMNENFDTSTPFGIAMVGILAVFAQLEREQIKERMNLGKEGRAKEGKWHGGSTEPIGYDYNVNDDMLYPNEYEQMQIRELRELFLQGTPLRTIETIFKEKGYTHKHGSTWDPKTMRRVLRSKLYLGYIVHNGELYPGLHEATVDVETYDKVVAILDERAKRYKNSGVVPGAYTTYLGGLLKCKKCGAKYTKTDWPNRDGTRKTLYGCYSRTKKVKKMIKDPNCKNKHWKKDELDNIVFNEIRKLSLDREYLKQLQADQKTDDADDKIAIIKKEIANLDAQISRFMDLYGIGKFTIEQVSDKVDPLNSQRDKLLKELDKLTEESGRLTEDQIVEIAESFDSIFERGNFDETRLVIETLIQYIELDDEDIYIHWNFA